LASSKHGLERLILLCNKIFVLNHSPSLNCILNGDRCSWLACRTVFRGDSQLLAAAAVQHRPVAARYDGTRRLLCPHVVDYNPPGGWRVFCDQYSGQAKSGPLPERR
jgi:hypothetical protein